MRSSVVAAAAAIGLFALLCGGAGAAPVSAQAPIIRATSTGGASAAAAGERTWTARGLERKGIVCPPTRSSGDGGAPVVFVFHGHGGTAKFAQRGWQVEAKWPEAVVVYLQGLPSKGITDPAGEKNGWETQRNSDPDRDLAFFDAAFATMKSEFKIDPKKVFAAGHSNGGSMAYLLWARRGDLFAAVGPSSSVAAWMRPELKPKPAIVVAGKKDPIVPFALQSFGHDGLKKIDGCDPSAGKPWPVGGAEATRFEGTAGVPFVTWVHEGGHEMPKGSVEAIVAFFKEVAAGR